MNREQQDLAWRCLPKEVRDKIKETYNEWDNTISFEPECILYDGFSPDSVWADAWEQIQLPSGTISKIIGHHLTWCDEPVKIE